MEAKKHPLHLEIGSTKPKILLPTVIAMSSVVVGVGILNRENIVPLVILAIAVVAVCIAASRSASFWLVFSLAIGTCALLGIAWGFATWSDTFSRGDTFSRVVGGISGAAVAPWIMFFWWPPIIAAISARRFPTLDSADATRSISAGWSALVLLGTMLFEMTVILPRFLHPDIYYLNGDSGDSRLKYLLSFLFIALAMIVELVLWRMARARIKARIRMLNEARSGSLPSLSIVPLSSVPTPSIFPVVRIGGPAIRIGGTCDLGCYDAILVEQTQSATYRDSPPTPLGLVTAADFGDSLPRATFQNFVRAQLPREEITTLTLIVVVTSVMVGGAWWIFISFMDAWGRLYHMQ